MAPRIWSPIVCFNPVMGIEVMEEGSRKAVFPHTWIQSSLFKKKKKRKDTHTHQQLLRCLHFSTFVFLWYTQRNPLIWAFHFENKADIQLQKSYRYSCYGRPTELLREAHLLNSMLDVLIMSTSSILLFLSASSARRTGLCRNNAALVHRAAYRHFLAEAILTMLVCSSCHMKESSLLLRCQLCLLH